MWAPCGGEFGQLLGAALNTRAGPSSSVTPMTTPVSRRLSDRSSYTWGAVWSATVLVVLGLLWVLGDPLQLPVLAISVLVGVFLSAFFTRPNPRVDATPVLSIGPATLFLVLDSTSAPSAVPLW